MKNLTFINRHRGLKAGLLFGLMLSFNPLADDTKLPTETQKLDRNEQTQMIETLITRMQREYVFPQKAERVSQVLRDNLSQRKYKHIANGSDLAKTLTEQLQQITNDKHLVVEFDARGIPEEQDKEAIAQKEAFEQQMWQVHNYGFEKIERLRFNTGYLKLSAFGPVKAVAPLLASAMNLLNNSDSLIIDMRGNFGGDEQTVQLFASYLLDKRTHLLNMYKRKGDVTEQHWSSDYVQGQRFDSQKDVYILTDRDSFSAAEDFSYTMQNLNRATLIGEVTGGAANAGDIVRLTEHFSMFLPTSRGISPITNTNWEGTGVTPDIKVPGEDALNRAQIEILNKLIAVETDTRRIARIKAFITKLKI